MRIWQSKLLSTAKSPAQTHWDSKELPAGEEVLPGQAFADTPPGHQNPAAHSPQVPVSPLKPGRQVSGVVEGVRAADDGAAVVKEALLVVHSSVAEEDPGPPMDALVEGCDVGAAIEVVEEDDVGPSVDDDENAREVVDVPGGVVEEE
eukprot:662858-Rhodomonas_salina.4